MPVSVPETVLTGVLGPIGLSSLLHLVEGDMLTGRLIWPEGAIAFVRGQLVDVVSGGLSGLPGLRCAFTHERGAFSLTLDETIEGTPMGRMAPLIMDACRVADEWARLRTLRLAPRDPGPWDAPALIQAVLPYLDGERPVAQAVGLAGAEPVVVTDGLLAFWESGALVERGEPVRAELLDVGQGMSLEALIDAGRDALRSRTYDQAILLFEAAARRDPDHRTIQQNLRRVRELAQNV